MNLPLLTDDQIISHTLTDYFQRSCLLGWIKKSFFVDSRFDVIASERFKDLLCNNIEKTLKRKKVSFFNYKEKRITEISKDNKNSFITVANDYFLTAGQRCAVWNKTVRDFLK